MSVTRNDDGTYTVNMRELFEIGKLGGHILETFDKLRSLEDKQIEKRSIKPSV